MNTQRFVLLSVAISLVSLSASSAAEPFHLEWVWVETPFGKSVIDRGPVGEWDHAAVDNPYVYAEDGRFYCFFEAQDTKRSGWHERIGLAVSDDGVKWNKSPDNPVLDVGRKGAWDGVVAKLPSGVIKRADRYYLFYSGRNHSDIRKTAKAIGVATATSLAGPWRKHDGNPILSGRADGWDRHLTTLPVEIFKQGGSYRLLYRGMKGFYHDQGLGAATSDDLLNWSRVGEAVARPLIPTKHEIASISVAFAGGEYVGISQPLNLAKRTYWRSHNLLDWKQGPAVRFLASVKAETISNLFLANGRWNVLYEQGDRIYRAVLTPPKERRP